MIGCLFKQYNWHDVYCRDHTFKELYTAAMRTPFGHVKLSHPELFQPEFVDSLRNQSYRDWSYLLKEIDSSYAFRDSDDAIQSAVRNFDTRVTMNFFGHISAAPSDRMLLFLDNNENIDLVKRLNQCRFRQLY